MTRASTLYTGFDRGEYGSLPSWQVGFGLNRGRSYYRGAWTGHDTLRYIGGGLGPRLKAQKLTFTGAPALPVTNIGTGYPTAGGFVIWLQSSTGGIYSCSPVPPGTASNALTSYAVTAYTPLSGGVSQASFKNLTVIPAIVAGPLYGLVKIDHDAHTVAPIAGAPTDANLAAVVCQYGDRTLAAFGSRVWYSGPQAPTDWSGTWSGGPGAGLNYFDIPSGAGVVGLYPTRGHLSIACGGAAGDVRLSGPGPGQWWILTGVPGVNDFLRKVYEGPPAARGCVIGDGSVGYAAIRPVNAGSGPQRTTGPIATFNGSRINEMRHLQLDAGPVLFPVSMPLRAPTDWITMWRPGGVSATVEALLFRDGAPSLHLFAEIEAGADMLAVAVPEADLICFVANSADFTKVYAWSAFVDDPLGASEVTAYGTAGGGAAGSTYAGPGDVLIPVTTGALTTLSVTVINGGGTTVTVTGTTTGTVYVNAVALGSLPVTFTPVTDATVTISTGSTPPSTGRGTTYLMVGAGYTAGFTLPEFYDRGGAEMAVRGVYVDFTTYAGLPAGNNFFDVYALAMRVYGSTDAAVVRGGVSTDAHSYTDVQPLASGRQRRLFTFAPVFGNAWQLSFANLRGVAIEKVTVLYDERMPQGV